ncbi:glycoside hydrolase family 97 C-terminal domain-containing protein [Mucilaginibacter sp. HMF5004]|uniref:glycoside hydrolase family 97 protein n=1 Tax=Mucilaginibacter rivuli TaxID=2857527 RepID=UPI001C601897|nr:glycoside hydrolase family 97 protein [Mucilaginibacter rivuli]MBW4889735.1 glycoside hydrolase family 97 C-terminal domain-containing protein [Mucilaginibacter rivuli]
MRKFLCCLYLIAACITRVNAQVNKVDEIRSPDGKTVLQIGKDKSNQLYYQLAYRDKQVTNWSVMGLKVNGANLGDSVTIISTNKDKHRETFAWPLGETKTVENNYQQLTLSCKSGSFSFDVITRLFDGALAFRYVVNKTPGQHSIINHENTQYNLTDDYTVYQYHEESVFSKLQLNAMAGTCDFPATLAKPGKLYLSIGEADNRSYTKCVLVKGGQPNSLALSFYIDTLYRNHQVSAIKKDSLIQFTGSFKTPWRTISCAENAIGLHDNSQLYIKLTEPLSDYDPTKVKPGKVVRVELTTAAALQGIDFAAKHNFSYILVDAGWYGAEFRTTSDPTKPIDGFDVQKITAYGKQKGIGVILYVNYVGLRQKLDTILPLYKSWGVAGLKFGFVDGGTQKGLSWLDTAMKKVNDYGFILNVHDHYKPTGLSRRYPFQVSQEGIRGDENSPDAFHTMVLPYTRFLAGAADFTFCYPNSRANFAKNLKVSKGQQLALSVVYFSPLPSIFWYGKPADYTNEKEIEFFNYLPTVWDDSRYLAGDIGENISVARKNNNVWYIGSATGYSDWKTTLKLDFLDAGKTYEATVYEDDGDKGINIHTIKLKKGSSLPITITATGGQAIIIRPV